jgi:hypothetical protein
LLSCSVAFPVVTERESGQSSKAFAPLHANSTTAPASSAATIKLFCIFSINVLLLSKPWTTLTY